MRLDDEDDTTWAVQPGVTVDAGQATVVTSTFSVLCPVGGVTPPPAYGTTGQSCTGLGDVCQSEDCCTSLTVPGGSFPMGRCNTEGECPDWMGQGAGEGPEHTATVSSFELDKYEVTVGRFRRFVEAYDGTPPTSRRGRASTHSGHGLAIRVERPAAR